MFSFNSSSAGVEEYPKLPFYSSIKERADDSQFQPDVTNHWPLLMGKKENKKERRTARRFEVKWDIAVESATKRGGQFTETGTLQNLSSSGAFFLLPRRLKLGATHEVEIRVPMKEKSWMRYSAKVVRVKKLETDFGVAVNFATARPTFTDR